MTEVPVIRDDTRVVDRSGDPEDPYGDSPTMVEGRKITHKTKVVVWSLYRKDVTR